MNLQEMAKGLEIRTYNKNQYVFKEKSMGNQEMFFIFSGTVAITKSVEGMEEEINLLQAGSFFGEIALIQNVPRLANAKVVSDQTKVGVISRNNFIVLSKTNPEFLVVLFRKLQERIMSREEMRDMLNIQESELKDALSNEIWVNIQKEDTSLS